MITNKEEEKIYVLEMCIVSNVLLQMKL